MRIMAGLGAVALLTLSGCGGEVVEQEAVGEREEALGEREEGLGERAVATEEREELGREGEAGLAEGGEREGGVVGEEGGD